jgi:hypothetical protein
MVVGHADKALQLRAVSRWQVVEADWVVCVRSMLAPRRKKKGSSRRQRRKRKEKSPSSQQLSQKQTKSPDAAASNCRVLGLH